MKIVIPMTIAIATLTACQRGPASLPAHRSIAASAPYRVNRRHSPANVRIAPELAAQICICGFIRRHHRDGLVGAPVRAYSEIGLPGRSGNLIALRGDLPLQAHKPGSSSTEFRHAADLVRTMRFNQ